MLFLDNSKLFITKDVFIMEKQKINHAELKTKIANEIRNMQLDGALSEEAVNKIYNDVINKVRVHQASEGLQRLIPEERQSNQPVNPVSPTDSGNPYTLNPDTPPAKSELDIFPTNDKLMPGPINQGLTGGTNYTNVDGNTNINQGTTGNIPAYKPKLPAFMDKIGAADVIIFNTNEVSEGGENLSNKPFRTMENPDLKKSMHDFWLENGKQRANVYIAKFEKIGEIDFNYNDGTSQFTEKRVDIDNNQVSNYQENPYKEKSTPETIKDKHLDAAGLETYIKSSIDLEKVVHDMVSNILKDYFQTNKATAVQQETSLNNPDGPNFGYRPDDAVKPMQESVSKFDLKVIDVVTHYTRKDIPLALQESINKGSTEFLKNKNDEVEEWLYEGVSYFMPVGKITVKKGYVKESNSHKNIL